MPETLKLSSKVLKKIKLFDSIAKYSIYTLIMLLPVIFFASSSAGIDQIKVGLLILATSVSIISIFISAYYSGHIHVISKKVLIPVVLISAFTFLSSILSTTYKGGILGTGTELDSWYMISLLLLTTLLIAHVLNTKERIFTALTLFWVGFGVTSFFQIIRFLAAAFKLETLSLFFNFGGQFGISSINTIGTWGDFGMTAGVAALSLAITLDTPEMAVLKNWMKNTFWSLFALFTLMSFVTSSILVGSGIDQLTNGSQFVIPSMTVIGFFALLFALFQLKNKGKKIKKVKEVEISKESPAESSAIEKEKEKEKEIKNFPLASFILIVLGVIVMISPLAINQKINHSLGVPNESVLNVRPGISDTYVVAKSVLGSSVKNSLLGVGTNGFYIVWNQYRPAYINTLSLWNTDYQFGVGYLPTILINNGILGLLLWVLSLGALFIMSFLILFKRNNGKKKVGAKDSNYVLIVTLLPVSLLWFNLLVNVPSASVLILTFIFTGLLLGGFVSNKNIESSECILTGEMVGNKIFIGGISRKKISIVIMSILAVSILFIDFSWIQRIRAQDYSTDAMQMIYSKSANINTVPTSIELLKHAFSIYSSDVYAREINNLELVQINYNISSDPANQDIKAIQGGQALGISSSTASYLESAVSYGRSSVVDNPNDFRNYLQLGSTLQTVALITADQNAGKLALQSFLQAVNLAPNHPLPLYSLANLYMLAGDKDSAKMVLDQVLKIKPDFAEASEMYQKILTENSTSSTSKSDSVSTSTFPTLNTKKTSVVHPSISSSTSTSSVKKITPATAPKKAVAPKK